MGSRKKIKPMSPGDTNASSLPFHLEISPTANADVSVPMIRVSHFWSIFVAYVAVAMLIYGPALNGEFIWDDYDIYIVDNPLLARWDGIFRFWFTNDPVDYYPLTYTTLWLEHAIVGHKTLLYHFDNVWLHALTAAVLGRVLERLQVTHPWLLATIFLVHPIQLESVAWICQRKSVLGTLFGLASANFYFAWESNPARRIYVWSLIFFILALSAKPVLIMLPVLLVLRDWWGGRVRLTDFEILSRKYGAFFLASLIFGLVGVAFQQKLIGGVDVREQTISQRLATCGWCAWFYIYQTLHFWEMNFVYPRWSVPNTIWSWIPNLAWIIFLGALWNSRDPNRRWLFAAMFVYLLTMLPSLGLADVFFWRYSYVGDHYLYQSLPAILVGLGSAARCFPWPNKVASGARWVAWGFVAALSIASWQRAPVYQSAERIWEDTLAKNPGAALASANLAQIRLRQGKFEESRRLLEQSLNADPDLFEAHSNLGDWYRSQNMWTESLASHEQTLKLSPRFAMVHKESLRGAGMALYHLGRLRQSEERLKERLASFGDLPQADEVTSNRGSLAVSRVYLAKLYEQQGNLARAKEIFNAVLKQSNLSPIDRRELARSLDELGHQELAYYYLKPLTQFVLNDAGLQNDLGRLASQTKEPSLALGHFDAALQIEPNNPDFHRNRAILNMQLGNHADGTAGFRKVVELIPGDSRASSDLGLAYALLGQFDSAVEAFRQGLKIRPDDPLILRDLAWILATSSITTPTSAEESLSLAERAVQITNSRQPAPWDALAAARASLGQFDLAVQAQQLALRLAQETGQTALLGAYQERLSLYQSQKPYREVAPTDPKNP